MTRQTQHDGEEGYLLLGLTVMVFLLLLTLSIAAPLIAKDLEREKEVEAAHRGRQYARAIQLYYRKIGNYPGTLDQLDETNNQHFLRRHYVDPLTNGEFRLIAMGEQKTVLKGFFGMPLTGATSLNGGGIGGPSSSSGSSSIGGPSSGSPNTNNGDSSSLSLSSNSNNGSNSTGIGTSSGLSGGSNGNNGGSLFGGDVKGGKGAIVGVGTNKKGKAIVAVNGEDEFDKWEFLYDPVIDKMKANVSILGGGGTAGGGSTGFGSTMSSPAGTDITGNKGNSLTSSPTSPTPSAPGTDAVP